jgi:uncharacterized phage-like protein YoqJ
MKRQKTNKIAVDITKLSAASKRSESIPEFYEDETYNCVDCGVKCIFTAEIQKNWYEVSKRYFWQRPIRCDEHHKSWSEAKRKKLKMDQIIAELKDSGSNKLILECSEAIIAFYEQTGHGNLQMAKHLLKELEDYKSHSNQVENLKERINQLTK